jgi:hypothetical protein
VVAVLVFCCFVALIGCSMILVDIRGELRRLVKDYERTLAKDVRSRVQ